MLFNNLSFIGYMQILSYTIYGIKKNQTEQIPSLVSKEKVPQSPLIVILLLSSIKKTVSKLQQQRLLDSFISFSWS